MIPMPSDTDIAWAAGLFEGEGCFFATDKYERKTGTVRHCHSAQLAMSDLDVVQKFQAIVGVGGIVVVPPKKPHHKTMYRWQIQSRSGLERVADLFMPYLGKRRLEKLGEVLAVLPIDHDPLICDYCGESFVPQRDRRGHKRVFCSKRCGQRAQTGVLNPRKEAV